MSSNSKMGPPTPIYGGPHKLTGPTVFAIPWLLPNRVGQRLRGPITRTEHGKHTYIHTYIYIYIFIYLFVQIIKYFMGISNLG